MQNKTSGARDLLSSLFLFWLYFRRMASIIRTKTQWRCARLCARCMTTARPREQDLNLVSKKKKKKSFLFFVCCWVLSRVETNMREVSVTSSFGLAHFCVCCHQLTRCALCQQNTCEFQSLCITEENKVSTHLHFSS